MLTRNTVLGGDIMAEVANASCKSKLLVVVWRERYCFLTLAVVECDIGQIGDVALSGHHKSQRYCLVGPSQKPLVCLHSRTPCCET